MSQEVNNWWEGGGVLIGTKGRAKWSRRWDKELKAQLTWLKLVMSCWWGNSRLSIEHTDSRNNYHNFFFCRLQNWDCFLMCYILQGVAIYLKNKIMCTLRFQQFSVTSVELNHILTSISGSLLHRQPTSIYSWQLESFYIYLKGSSYCQVTVFCLLQLLTICQIQSDFAQALPKCLHNQFCLVWIHCSSFGFCWSVNMLQYVCRLRVVSTFSAEDFWDRACWILLWFQF